MSESSASSLDLFFTSSFHHNAVIWAIGILPPYSLGKMSRPRRLHSFLSSERVTIRVLWTKYQNILYGINLHIIDIIMRGFYILKVTLAILLIITWFFGWEKTWQTQTRPTCRKEGSLGWSTWKLKIKVKRPFYDPPAQDPHVASLCL